MSAVTEDVIPKRKPRKKRGKGIAALRKIRRALARKKLVELEQHSVDLHQDSGQLEMFSNREHPVVDRLKEMSLDNLTPREALDMLYQLQQDVKS